MPTSLASLLCAIAVFAGLHTVALGQALPTATGPGSSIHIGGGIAEEHIDYGDRQLGGSQVWVDSNPTWRVGLEAEARWLRYHRDPNGAQATTYLAGPRISLAPGPLEPYVKLLAGRGIFEFPFHYARGSYAVVAAGAGVDLHRGRWQLRPVDFEYQTWPGFSYGRMSPYCVSAGVGYSIVHSRGRSVR